MRKISVEEFDGIIAALQDLRGKVDEAEYEFNCELIDEPGPGFYRNIRPGRMTVTLKLLIPEPDQH